MDCTDMKLNSSVLLTCSSPLISTLICSLMEPDTEDLSDLFSR